VLALAIDHGGAHACGQVVHHVAQRQDQAVVQGIALGGAGEADDRDFLAFATDFKGDVGVLGHGGVSELGKLWLLKITKTRPQGRSLLGGFPSFSSDSYGYDK
jgi:hypothetical protein